jgi:hypothetical protein
MLKFITVSTSAALALSIALSAQAQTYSRTTEKQRPHVTGKCGNRDGNRICQIVTVKNGERTIENIVAPAPQQPANRPTETIYQH